MHFQMGGARMIAAAKIKEVERLLAENQLSHRKIAKATGISRATVGAIASGRRPDYEALRQAREPVAATRTAGALSRMRRNGLHALSSVPHPQAQGPRTGHGPRISPPCPRIGSQKTSGGRMESQPAPRRGRRVICRPKPAARHRIANSGTSRVLPAGSAFRAAARASARLPTA